MFNTRSANQNVCFVLQKDCMASNCVVPSAKVPVLASNWVVDAQYIEVAEHRSNSLLPSSLHFVGARRAL